MADKVSSSPSSMSVSTGAAAILTIVQHAPEYLFVEEVFEIHYKIDDVDEGGVPVHAELLEVSKDAGAFDAAAAATESSSCPSRNARIEIVNKEHSDSGNNRKIHKLQCKVMLQTGAATQNIYEVAFQIRLSLDAQATPVLTRPLTLVQAKLRIQTTPEWSSIWFKDEGGRDKCMEFYVELDVADGESKSQLLQNHRLALSLTLCYASTDNDHATPVRVMNQDVLRVIGAEKRLQIDKNTETARIRFRIEDVSKNHQGQDFVLRVVADESKYTINQHTNLVVAPTYTPAVSVRSKRNKRQRTSLDGTHMGQSHSFAAADATRASTPSTAAAAVGLYAHVAAVDQHQPLPLNDGNHNAEVVLEAMHGVVKWADEVYHGLHSLQWQVLGYARNEDGNPDFGHPYHSMYNPNTFINRMRATYSETTRKQLQVLEQALCPSSLSMTGRPGGSIMSPQPHDSTYWMPQSAMHPLPHLMNPLPLHHRPQQPVHEMNYEYPNQVPPRGYYGGQGVRSNLQPPGMPDARFDEPMPMQQQQQQQQPPPQQQAPTWHSHQPPHLLQQRSLTRMSMDQAERQQAGAATSPLTASSPEKPRLETTRDAVNHGEVVVVAAEQVEYVLAKQYKSLTTRQKLGFPAYSLDKKLLGFFTSSNKSSGANQFVSLSQLDDFASSDAQQQATDILQEAIDLKSDILYCLSDWGSLGNMLDRVFVYEWSKDISDAAVSNDHPLDIL
ncbi:hypothetical protein MPSEU_000621300 [Mayamaea pseudoterrestris]|nr:hypothetical protein MPSEU_000621300 [Mayamaea pseudoterrestris]